MLSMINYSEIKGRPATKSIPSRREFGATVDPLYDGEGRPKLSIDPK